MNNIAVYTEQISTRNYKLPSIDPKDTQKVLEETIEKEDTVGTHDIKSEIQSILDLGQVDLRALEIMIVRDAEIYLLDYSLPTDINTNASSIRYGDLKVDYLKKTRLALAISAAILSVSMVTALIALPYPYKIGALALCGPLFVSTYGLVTQK